MEALLYLEIRGAELLYEAIHRCSDAHQRLKGLTLLGSLHCLLLLLDSGDCVIEVNEHDLLLMRLLYVLLLEAMNLLELAYQTACRCANLLLCLSLLLLFGLFCILVVFVILVVLF